MSAYSVGAAAQALEMTVKYAKQRQQFGRPIASFQVLQHRLADMLVLVEGARLLVYQASWRLAQRMPATLETAAAKAWAGECINRVTNEAMRVYAGMGCSRECDIQLYYRRAKPLQLYLGDTTFCHGKIARFMRQAVAK